LTNLQIVLWSGVILGGYLSLALLKGGFLAEVTPNLLALIGVSAGSLVASKSIRTVQEQKIERKLRPGSRLKPQDRDRSFEKPITWGLLSEEKDPKELSIAKLQMFAWTIASVAIFISIVAGNLLNNKPELPDVGQDLLVLMGISHAAYIGNKIADTPPDQPERAEIRRMAAPNPEAESQSTVQPQ
jgi:hypothetical protein